MAERLGLACLALGFGFGAAWLGLPWFGLAFVNCCSLSAFGLAWCGPALAAWLGLAWLGSAWLGGSVTETRTAIDVDIDCTSVSWMYKCRYV